ncbi:hypothetical protein S83_004964, partial [Arachis hypogaea]
MNVPLLSSISFSSPSHSLTSPRLRRSEGLARSLTVSHSRSPSPFLTSSLPESEEKGTSQPASEVVVVFS